MEPLCYFYATSCIANAVAACINVALPSACSLQVSKHHLCVCFSQVLHPEATVGKRELLHCWVMLSPFASLPLRCASLPRTLGFYAEGCFMAPGLHQGLLVHRADVGRQHHVYAWT